MTTVFALIECDSCHGKWSYIPVENKPMTAYTGTTNEEISMDAAVGKVMDGDTVLRYVTYQGYFYNTIIGALRGPSGFTTERKAINAIIRACK